MFMSLLLINLFIVVAILFRITMLPVSIRRRKELLANVTTEYGAANSPGWPQITDSAFSCFCEAKRMAGIQKVLLRT